MKKIIILLVSSFLLFISVPVDSLAAPKKMANGNLFDAEFYMKNNPDVVAALGSDENVLYQHYINYGKAEGRLPYAEAEGTSSTADSGKGYKGSAGYTTSNLSSNSMIRNLEIGYLNHDYALIRDTVCGKGFMDMCKPYFTINTKDAYSSISFARDEDNYVLPSDVVHIKVSKINNINCIEVLFITSNSGYQMLTYYREGSIPSSKKTSDSDAFRLNWQTGELHLDSFSKLYVYPSHVQLFNLLPDNTISVYTDTTSESNEPFHTYQPYGVVHNPSCDNTIMNGM